jgi:hypothetical protein
MLNFMLRHFVTFEIKRSVSESEWSLNFIHIDYNMINLIYKSGKLKHLSKYLEQINQSTSYARKTFLKSSKEFAQVCWLKELSQILNLDFTPNIQLTI